MNDLFPYLRKAHYDDKEYVRKEVPGKCNFFEQEYNCELKIDNNIVKYDLVQFVYLFMNNFELRLKLNEDICKQLDKLTPLSTYYTKESLDKVFEKYPNTLLIIKNDFSIKWTAVRYEGYSLCKKGIFPSKNYFYNNYEKDWVREVYKIANGLMSELSHLEIDFNQLEKKEEKNFDVNIPSWLASAIVIGGVVLVKFAVKSIGNDIDIDIPLFDGDSDSTSIDIDTGEVLDGGDMDNNGDTDYSNISFGHAPNDGSYLKTNQDVNIQVAGGNDKGSYDVYLHNGDKYIDFKDQWVKIQGKTRFHLLGNDYIIK